MLVGGGLLTGPALAEQDPAPYPSCDVTPNEGDTNAAKGAFQAGQAAFNEADYTRAITYWEDAYRRDCTAHKLLINLARAYELDGQLKLAIRALETYNERVPGNPEMAQSETRIAKFRERLAAQAAAAASQPTASPTTAPTTDPGGNGGAIVDPPADAGGQRPLYPLFIAGGGAVLGIIGAVLYFPAQGTISDFEQKCPDRVCPAGVDDSEANSARGQATAGGVLMGVGAAAMVGGLVWYFVSPKQPATATRVAPAVGRGFSGLSFSGSF